MNKQIHEWGEGAGGSIQEGFLEEVNLAKSLNSRRSSLRGPSLSGDLDSQPFPCPAPKQETSQSAERLGSLLQRVPLDRTFCPPGLKRSYPSNKTRIWYLQVRDFGQPPWTMCSSDHSLTFCVPRGPASPSKPCRPEHPRGGRIGKGAAGWARVPGSKPATTQEKTGALRQRGPGKATGLRISRSQFTFQLCFSLSVYQLLICEIGYQWRPREDVLRNPK